MRTLHTTLLLLSCIFAFASCNGQTADSLADAPKPDTLVQKPVLQVDSLKIEEESHNIFVKSLAKMAREMAQVAAVIDSLERVAVPDSTGRVFLEDRKERLSMLQAQRSHFEQQRDRYHIEGNSVLKTKSAEGRNFSCYVVDAKSDVRLFWKDSLGRVYDNFGTYKQVLERRNQTLVFATNGGMYMPDQSPQGLYVENGKELHKIDLHQNKHGNFYMQPNGIFLLTKKKVAHVITSEAYKQFKEPVQFATQSGPMLVIEGKINAQFTVNSANFHIRSGVGVDSVGRMVFIISDERVRFYELAEAFLAFGCQNALYLDGAISETYLPELGLNGMGGGFGVMIGVVKD